MLATNRRTAVGLAVWVVILLVLMWLPGNIGRGPQDIVLNLLIWVGLAQAWNIIGGIGGQLSLGHSVFVGAGAYTTAMLLINSGTPWIVVLIAGAAVAAVVAWLVSFPILRLSGVYFTIGSAALALIAIAWMVTWTWTGESRGLNIPFEVLPDKPTVFRVIAVIAVLTCIVTYLLLKSSFGLRLMAVRDDEVAASALGVSPRSIKRWGFVLSAFLTGLMGGAIAFNLVSITPNTVFTLNWVVTALVMVIVGGIGTTWGPVVGAFVIYYLVNRSLDDQPVLAALLSGVLIIAVITLAPGGIVGSISRGWAWLIGRRSAKSSTPTSPSGPDRPAATPGAVVSS